MKDVSKIPAPPVIVAMDTPELQSRSASSLREELAAAPVDELGTDESVDGGSVVSFRDEPCEVRQDNLNGASEEQLAVKDDSRPSSTLSTPRSPVRGTLIPSPLDIASASDSLSRNVSPLAREAVKMDSVKAGVSSPGPNTPPSKVGNASPGMHGPHTPPVLSKKSSVESPRSPFFIPTNPFLMQVEKMPKFQWSTVHFNLLESLMKSLQEIINKWKRCEIVYNSFSLHLFLSSACLLYL